MKNLNKNEGQIRVTMIGCGLMAHYHIRTILSQFKNTSIPVICEPSEKQAELAKQVFLDAGEKPPVNEPDLNRLLEAYGQQLDAAFIITPHNLHHDQASACLEAGLDVLLEKPMVMNIAEAQDLIQVTKRSGRLLVVAFNGGLSPRIRTAAAMLRAGDFGAIHSISATIWQNWRELNTATWRQVPELAGGGFLFDTGAHMLNTVAELAGEEFVEIAAWLDNRDRDVDIFGTVMARLASGALVTMHGCGDTIPSCESDIRVFCTGAIIRTSAWGRFLEIQDAGSPTFEPLPVQESAGVWEEFLAIRDGKIANPSPPEVGLRMAILWDAIQRSAAHHGEVVSCQPISVRS